MTRTRTSLAPLACIAILWGAFAVVDAQAREHLVVLTEDGPEPRHVEVAPGDVVVWLNRSATAVLALRFDEVLPRDAATPCPAERAFRRVTGLPLFTALLAPGSVAVTCAPATGGEHRYELSGDSRAEGWLDVREKAP